MAGVSRGILDILSPRERRDAAFVLLIILTTGFFETAAVGAIASFVGFLTRPESIQDIEWLGDALRRFGWEEPRQALFVLGLAVLAVLISKNAFVAFATWKQVRFTWGKLFSLSSRLLERYLSQPYEYFLTRNSAVLSKNFLVDINQVVGDIIRPGMVVLSEGVIALSITTFLFWNDALLAMLVVLVFGGGYAMVYWNTRRRLKRIGQERLAAHEQRFRTAHEALGGIKEVKAFGREDVYLKRHDRSARVYVDHTVTEYMIAELPRFAVESLAFGGILGIIIFSVARQDDLPAVVTVASLYVAAGYRLMPSLNRISSSLAQLRFSEAILAQMHHDLVELGVDHNLGRSVTPMRFERGIELADVAYKYPAGEELAIGGISLTIQKGSSVGFVGATGSGKSTLADLVLGVIRPLEGRLLVDGHALTDDRVRDWQANVGYIPQHIFLSDDTVERNIAFGIPDDEIDHDAVAEAARLAGISGFIESELSKQYGTVVGERGIRFSGGQRQRLGIARALYHRPKLLLLDEATSALDTVTEAAVNAAINGLHGKTTLIVIAHRLSTIKNCDTIYLLEGGRLVAQGSYQSLLSDNEVFQRFVFHENEDAR